MEQKNIQLGFLMLSAWCLFSAVGDVLAGNTEQYIDPLLFCFYAFLFVNAIFLIANAARLKTIFQNAKKEWRIVLKINITTFLCWYLMFYPLKYIEPSIVMAVILGILPIATWLCGMFIYKKHQIDKSDVFFSFFFAIIVLYLFFLCIFDKNTSYPHTNTTPIVVSIIMLIAASVALAANTIYTKRLSDMGCWGPMAILTVRFWLIFFLGGTAFFFHHGATVMTVSLLGNIAISAVLLIVAPQLLFQIALKELQPIALTMLPPLTPALTFFIEFFSHKLNPSFYALLGVSMIGLCSIVGSILKYRRTR